MACYHKFKNDLYLGYTKDWEQKPETLIVGTFNPEWTDNNSAKWFYGRTENNFFWSVLPQVYGKESLLNSNENDWKHFCLQNHIAITDLIECITTADIDNEKHKLLISSFSDKKIETNFGKENDLKLVNVVKILQENPTIKHVYLTRSATGLWGKLWKSIKDYCSENMLVCTELLTPSGNARFQYTKEQQKKFPSQTEFIVFQWKQAIEKNHSVL